MAKYDGSIDVHVTVRTAYDQWTQFESFPQFMEGVEEVRQIDDTTLAWRAEIGGQTESWEADITEQVQDQRIAWTSRTGAKNAGVVTFHPIDDATTRMKLEIEYEPDTLVEQAGSALGFVGRRIEGDLKRFKEFIEAQPDATSARMDDRMDKVLH